MYNLKHSLIILLVAVLIYFFLPQIEAGSLYGVINFNLNEIIQSPLRANYPVIDAYLFPIISVFTFILILNETYLLPQAILTLLILGADITGITAILLLALFKEFKKKPIMQGATLAFGYLLIGHATFLIALLSCARIEIIALSFLTNLFFYRAKFPTFPLGARIVPSTGFSTRPEPFIGDGNSIEVIFRAAEKELALFPSLVFIFIGLVELMQVYKISRVAWTEREFKIKTKALTLTTVGLLVFSTTIPCSGYLSELSPVLTLNKLIPGLETYSVVLFLIYFAIYQLLTIENARISIFGLALLIILPFKLAPIFDRSQLSKTATPTNFVISHAEQTGQSLCGDYKFISIKELTLESRNNPEALSKILDGDLKSKWSTKQKGNETIRVRFNQPFEFKGLKLDTGSSETDFPKGIRISTGDKILTDIPNWLGEIKISADNQPYFWHQSDYILKLSTPVILNELKIEQIGHSTLDWSIAELEFATGECTK